ncbi:MAG: hypothetical protein AAF926_00310 [Pseudomonadota bacterium]
MKENVFHEGVNIGLTVNWNEAAILLADRAEELYANDFDGEWNNYTQRRMMCLNKLHEEYGAEPRKQYPSLKTLNGYEYRSSYAEQSA